MTKLFNTSDSTNISHTFKNQKMATLNCLDISPKTHRQLKILKYHLQFRLRRYRFRLFLITTIFILVILYIFGIFTRQLELQYERHFVYPYHSPNFRHLIEDVKTNQNSQTIMKPLNNFTLNYHYSPVGKCESKSSRDPGTSTLLIVVKSAVCNYQFRAAIRQTWGFEKGIQNFHIQTVFMLGKCVPPKSESDLPQHCDVVSSSQLLLPNYLNWLPRSTGSTIDCQKMIDAEYDANRDLIQADFVDSYYNNTRKTLASLHWTVKNCAAKVPLILFVDDDYYVSVKNLVKSVKEVLRKDTQQEDTQNSDTQLDSTQPFDGRLYMGYLFPYSRPIRQLTSKHYISLAQYPYSRYPPYITGGCFLVTNSTVTDLYYASLYTKTFLFDDVYLGILAKKMNIQLRHNQNIYFEKYSYYADGYGQVVASHGYNDPEEMIRVWTEQKSFVNA